MDQLLAQTGPIAWLLIAAVVVLVLALLRVRRRRGDTTAAPRRRKARETPPEIPAERVAWAKRGSERPVPKLPSVHPIRQAVVFQQDLPPPHDPRRLGYFGGTPTAPQSFEWPRHEHDGVTEPLHFIMQVDCRDVPLEARLDALPDRGVIYFFLDLDRGRTNHFRVLYEPSPSPDWAPIEAPADLGPAYGKEAPHVWKWMRGTPDGAALAPKLLPKWVFRARAIGIPEAAIERWREEQDGEPDPLVFWWPGEDLIKEQLLAAQGEKIATDFPAASMTLPYEGYPQDWRAIQIAAGLMLDRLRRHPEDQASLGPEAGEWLARAAGHEPFEAVPATDREAFWAWLQQHEAQGRMILREAATMAVEAALAGPEEAAARIPSEAVAAIHARHALASRHEGGIFAAPPDRMLAPPSYVQGDQEEIARSHLLLLELSSNEGLGHFFGEGVYQFWITPADLRERRFDRVQLTTAAY